jgi:hypothetical protein
MTASSSRFSRNFGSFILQSIEGYESLSTVIKMADNPATASAATDGDGPSNGAGGSNPSHQNSGKRKRDGDHDGRGRGRGRGGGQNRGRGGGRGFGSKNPGGKHKKGDVGRNEWKYVLLSLCILPD